MTRSNVFALVLAFLLHMTAGTGVLMAEEQTLRQQAADALTGGETARAAELYRRLLEQDADDGEAHYRLGVALMDLDRLDEAAPHFREARALGYQAHGADYRLARIHARRDEAEAAIARLEDLGAAGFGMIRLIEDESDFEALAGDPDFEAAVSGIRANRFPCSDDPRHHAFDFWIGEWDVYNDGKLAGTNSIQPILGHCTLLEQWTGRRGGKGKSFNYYDPGYDHWRQVWISDSGSFIEFTGEARDGGIYYTATTVDEETDEETLHRFNFTPNEDGSVRQHWMQSTDGGETWNTVWDGRYVRETADAGD